MAGDTGARRGARERAGGGLGGGASDEEDPGEDVDEAAPEAKAPHSAEPDTREAPANAPVVTSTLPAAPTEGDDDDEPARYVEAEVETASRYLWHGVALSDGPVLQPTARAVFDGFSASASANLVLAADRNQGQFTEAGAEFGYTHTWGPFTLEPGVQLLAFPHQQLKSTGEVSVLAEFLFGGDVSVTTHHLVDVVGQPGAYFGEAGLSWAPSLGHHLGLEANASLGWASARFNGTYHGVEKAAVDVLETEALLTWSPRDWLRVRARVGVSVLLDDELRRAAGSPVFPVVGVALVLRR